MSNLTDLLGGLLGGGGQGQGGGGGGKGMAAMAAVAAPMVVKFLQGGGLNKLLGGFQEKGMADKAESWVGTGENKPITPQELEQVVGTEEIDQIAQQTGASREQTEEMLAKALPEVVNRVSPNGQLPDQAQLDQMLGQMAGPQQ
jgi:uncharacterized protein YidB (DUF937 family)